MTMSKSAGVCGCGDSADHPFDGHHLGREVSLSRLPAAASKNGIVLLICGGREWTNYGVVERELEAIHREFVVNLVIHGGARGADTLGGRAAKALRIPVRVYMADWERYGKAAGIRRNYEMLRQGNPDHVLAFHSDLGKSKGTKHMLEIAEGAGVPTHLVTDGVNHVDFDY